MKFRPQRGGLEESMKAMVELEPTRQALAAHLKVADDRRIDVERYCYDYRTHWDTYCVTVDGNGVGFTDGPLDELPGGG